MQGTLQNVSKEPWVESILPCPDKKFCALEAYKRQCALLETKGNEPLFRSVKCYDVNLGPQRGTTKLCAGAATWASKVFGRKMVFKDLAQRAAMTKVANSALPLLETSKYFHIKVDTMMGYYQALEGTVPKVACILSAHPCAPKPTTSSTTAEEAPLPNANVEEVQNPAEEAEEAPLPNVVQVQTPAQGVEEAPLPNGPLPKWESKPCKG